MLLVLWRASRKFILLISYIDNVDKKLYWQHRLKRGIAVAGSTVPHTQNLLVQILQICSAWNGHVSCNHIKYFKFVSKPNDLTFEIISNFHNTNITQTYCSIKMYLIYVPWRKLLLSSRLLRFVLLLLCPG